VQNHY
jgi:hypothetical protein